MKPVKTYNVQIWIGLREAYTNIVHPIDDVEQIVDEFVNDIKDCVTITPTYFRYVNGHEPGVIIGWINYPRFPRDPSEIRERAMFLAEDLMIKLGQIRVSIVTPEKTYMLENKSLKEEI